MSSIRVQFACRVGGGSRLIVISLGMETAWEQGSLGNSDGLGVKGCWRARDLLHAGTGHGIASASCHDMYYR